MRGLRGLKVKRSEVLRVQEFKGLSLLTPLPLWEREGAAQRRKGEGATGQALTVSKSPSADSISQSPPTIHRTCP
ncbi:hypothetical protein DEFR109230_06650 [Deinococcus frigens]